MKHPVWLSVVCLANTRFPVAVMWRMPFCGVSTPALVPIKVVPVSPRPLPELGLLILLTCGDVNRFCPGVWQWQSHCYLLQRQVVEGLGCRKGTRKSLDSLSNCEMTLIDFRPVGNTVKGILSASSDSESSTLHLLTQQFQRSFVHSYPSLPLFGPLPPPHCLISPPPHPPPHSSRYHRHCWWQTHAKTPLNKVLVPLTGDPSVTTPIPWMYVRTDCSHATSHDPDAHHG